MTILCLEEVHNQAISCQASHKDIFCLRQIVRKVSLEKFLQREWFLEVIFEVLFEFVEGDGIFDHFDDATVWTHG
jgi:hypothetical protein